MLTTLQGVYRKGKIVLMNNPSDIPDETPVIVTFLGVEGIDLRARGITEEQARARREGQRGKEHAPEHAQEHHRVGR